MLVCYLLAKCGLLCSRVTTLVKDVPCDITQLVDIAKLFSSKLRIEFTCIRTSLSRRSYLYCIGSPIYPNPSYQQQVFCANKELPVKKLPPPCIMNAVKKQQQDLSIVGLCLAYNTFRDLQLMMNRLIVWQKQSYR